MLRFICRLVIFMAMLSIGNCTFKFDPQKYVHFLSDIEEYYKSSGIFFLYNDNSERFELQRNLGILSREFSKRGVLTQAFPYSRLMDKSHSTLSHIVQSLFVVFLSSRIEYENFGIATKNHDMSRHTWVIIFTGFIDDYIDEICINPIGNPFNLVFNSRMIISCYKDDTIWKWYSLHRNKTEVLELARWNKKLGISYKNKNYYAQRYDLDGTKMRIATQTNSTMEMNGKMSGFFEETLSELQNFMNFTIISTYQDDAHGKYRKETGEWTGLMKLVIDEKVDLVVAPMTITKLRLDYVDFTMPMLLSQNRIYIKQPAGARIQWSAYFQAFTISSWSSIASLLLTASFLTALIRKTIYDKKYSELTMNYFLENFMSIWGIYCQQGLSDFSTVTPLRLAYFTMLLMTLVLWAIYSASITSYLTFLSPSLPFTDTEGFVKDGSYKLIVLRNSSDHQIIMSGEDPVLSTLQPLLYSSDDLPTNPFDGFQEVCEKRVGFYSSEVVLKGVSGYIPCTLTYIETGQFECLTMVMMKSSPFITSINYNLRKLEDNGVMKKLRYWYFHNLEEVLESKHSAIGIWGVAPLLAIFASGFIISLIILILEHIIYFYRNKIKTKKYFYF